MWRLTFMFLGIAVIGVDAPPLPPPPPETINFSWDYPTNEMEGITFRLYMTTDLAIPKEKWHRIAETTNLIATVHLTRVPSRFFVCTAFNGYAESEFFFMTTNAP